MWAPIRFQGKQKVDSCERIQTRNVTIQSYWSDSSANATV